MDVSVTVIGTVGGVVTVVCARVFETTGVVLGPVTTGEVGVIVPEDGVVISVSSEVVGGVIVIDPVVAGDPVVAPVVGEVVPVVPVVIVAAGVPDDEPPASDEPPDDPCAEEDGLVVPPDPCAVDDPDDPVVPD